MKKLTRKLFISILAAVFAVVALGTSTFAWITISNTASVSAFNGTVEAGEAGIELSLDYGTAGDTAKWYTNVPSTVLQDVVDANFTQFADITSTDGKTFLGYTIQEGQQPVEEEHASLAKKYIEFKIWVRIANAKEDSKLTVKLNEETMVLTDESTGSYTPDVALGKQNGIRVSNAARISFATGETGENVIAIYEQNGSVNNNTTGFAKSGFAYSYLLEKGYKDKTKVAEDLSHGVTSVQSLPDAPGEGVLAGAKEIGTANEQEMLKLVYNTPQALTVRIWVEGWDNECHYGILNQQLSVKFAFTSEKTPEPEAMQ